MERVQKSFRKFQVIWAGQFISILGSGLSSFGLSVWILTATQSTMNFALSFIVKVLPAIFFSPLAGSFADRKNRKAIMILSDTGDAIIKLLFALLYCTNHLHLGAIYVGLFLSSTLNTFQSPAFHASLPEIVPKDKLDRANGMLQIISSVQSLIAPVLAGALYPLVQFGGLLVIDIVTYCVGILTLAFQVIPQPVVENVQLNIRTVLQDFLDAYRYIRQKIGLMNVLLIFAMLNFVANLSFVLLGPLVLSVYSPWEFGLVESIGGLAMIAGSILGSVMPPVQNRVRLIFALLTISGMGLMIMGLSQLWYIIAMGVVVFMIPVPYVNGTFGTLLQTKIDGFILGRVSALLGAFLQVMMPIAYILAGILPDQFFNPLLAEGGAWTQTFLAHVVGVGKTRGTGLIFILCGILIILLCVLGSLSKKTVQLETLNPDVVSE